MFARGKDEKSETTATAVDNRTLAVRIVVAFATVTLVIMLIGLIFNFANLGRLAREKTALQRELIALEQEIARNDSLLDHLTTDEYLEQLAREQLGMTGEGELVYT